MNNLLVTGGAGFIGSNFVKYWRAKHPDWRIFVYDSLTYAGNLHNLDSVKDQITFVRADVADELRMETLFGIDKITHVVHMAAESHVDRSIISAYPFIYTNVIGTQVLLDASKRRGIERFIYVSTDEVYGDLPPDAPKAKETNHIKASSPYAASKAAADLLVQSYIRTHNFPAIITRCTNNYGPAQFPEKLIPFAISLLMEKKKVPVYGDGKQTRDWIHVNDHCSAIESALLFGKLGEIYNVAADNEIDNLSIIDTLASIIGVDHDYIEFVRDRPGHDRRYALNANKLIVELGWTPKYNLVKGLTETVDWYKSNPEWINSVKTKEYLEYRKTNYSNTECIKLAKV